MDKVNENPYESAAFAEPEENLQAAIQEAERQETSRIRIISRRDSRSSLIMKSWQVLWQESSLPQRKASSKVIFKQQNLAREQVDQAIASR